jgi:TonB family protein
MVGMVEQHFVQASPIEYLAHEKETHYVTPVATPTPPTTKPRLVCAPAPAFPQDVHSRLGASWSGRFSLSFDSRGNVTKVQIIQSTGNERLDEAAISTLSQWKSAPGREWVGTVPIAFQAR